MKQSNLDTSSCTSDWSRQESLTIYKLEVNSVLETGLIDLSQVYVTDKNGIFTTNK